MMGADDGFSEIPSGKPKPIDTGLLGHPVNPPPNMVKWANVRSKQLLEIKGIRYIYLKVLMIKVTHTMIPGMSILRHITIAHHY